MEKEILFRMLTSPIWQDWNSHIRIEKQCDFDEIFYPLRKAVNESWTGVILALFFILFGMLWYLIGPIMAFVNRARISRNAYDIEVTTSDYKLIRNNLGRIGVCYWHNWYNCKLLLPTKFDNIEHLTPESFVITIDSKHGVYSADKNIYIKPVFETYKIEGKFVIFTTANSEVKYNCHGERVLI